MMKIVVPICLFMLFVFSTFSQEAKPEERSDGYYIDTLTFLFYVDGERVTIQELRDIDLRDSTLRQVDGAIFGKDAVLRFGEKARYGIFIFETEKKDEDNSND